MKRSSARSVALQSTVFVQKRKAQKVIREVYLRTDIACGSQICANCQSIESGTLSTGPKSTTLSTHPRSTHSLGSHYIMPDTNIFYHSMDIMEQANVFCDVIVLQTALDELRNKSLPLYNRLRQLIADSEKRFYVFHNEYHIETFVKREVGETINDRNDRAIRFASLWYRDHLAKAARGTKMTIPGIVLLTNDSANRHKAADEGIQVLSLRAYLGYEENSDYLLDMVAAEDQKQIRKSAGESVYHDHFNVTRLQEGVKQGSLHQGILNISAYNFLEATCAVPAFKHPLHIVGREHLNRAMQADIVVLEILPESDWTMSEAKLLEAEAFAKTDNPEEDGEQGIFSAEEQREVDVKASATDTPSRRSAKVVGILKRNWRPYVGHLDTASIARTTQTRGIQSVFIQPVDRRLPKIRIRTRQTNALIGQKLVVNIDRWDKTSRYPDGHFVRALGQTETKEAETEALLLEWDVQYRPFPKAVLDCLPVEGAAWIVPQDLEDSRWHQRADLRHLLVCSIDPPGCQDIDDALHAKPLPNGNIEVGVHIADVSSFVKADTPMDTEAAARGTTVYMVDKRIDMLPHLLGTNLCSLMPYVERFAFSTIWELTKEGQILNVKFTKSVIKSRDAFSYAQAQSRIDDMNTQDELTQGMRLLLGLSKKLRAARLAAGALNLASPEVRIEMDNESSDPIDVQTKEALETNSLVEEFMLLANISVATKIQEAFPETAMLRRHGAPPATNFELLQNILFVKRNLRLQVDSSKALADSLDHCVDEKAPFFNTLVRIMATRCMLSAEYFPAGSLPEDEYKHYGLASSIYTHFTSPIRRYADVIAHRQLSAAIGFESLHPSLQNLTKMSKICNNINYRHRMAQMAGRASVEFYVGQSLKGHEATGEAHIMKVFENGIVVFVPKFGIEGVIKLSSMGEMEPEARYNPENYELLLHPGKPAELSLSVFDRVQVKIVTHLEAGTGKRKIELSLHSQ